MWGLTLFQRGGDVLNGWLTCLRDYLHGLPGIDQPAKALAFFLAIEVGGRAKRKHIQGVMRLRCPATEAGRDLVQHEIREFLPLSPSDSPVLVVKPFDNVHWEPMLGSCQKDAGQAHYHCIAYNIPHATLRAAREAYHNTSLSFTQGRTQLNKDNYADLLFQFLSSQVDPLKQPADVVLQQLLQEGNTVPAFSWVEPPHGKALDRSRMRAWWRIVTDPKQTRIADVNRVFFDLSAADPDGA